MRKYEYFANRACDKTIAKLDPESTGSNNNGFDGTSASGATSDCCHRGRPSFDVEPTAEDRKEAILFRTNGILEIAPPY